MTDVIPLLEKRILHLERNVGNVWILGNVSLAPREELFNAAIGFLNSYVTKEDINQSLLSTRHGGKLKNGKHKIILNVNEYLNSSINSSIWNKDSDFNIHNRSLPKEDKFFLERQLNPSEMRKKNVAQMVFRQLSCVNIDFGNCKISTKNFSMNIKGQWYDIDTALTKFGKSLPSEMQKPQYYYNTYDEKANEANLTRSSLAGKRNFASVENDNLRSREQGPSHKLSKLNDHNDSGIN